MACATIPVSNVCFGKFFPVIVIKDVEHRMEGVHDRDDGGLGHQHRGEGRDNERSVRRVEGDLDRGRYGGHFDRAYQAGGINGI
mgnify:CR=1 FL=1